MSKQSFSFILDISRLLSRAGQNVPTGIDRVELAYAEYLLTHHKDNTYFAAFVFPGWIGFLPQKVVLPFISALAAGWNLGKKSNIAKARKISRALKTRLFLPPTFPVIKGTAFYLLVSHHHLMNIKAIRHFLSRTHAHFIPMIHDIIPIEYPEYSRPREMMRHKARMKTVMTLADAIIVPTNQVGISVKSLFTSTTRHNLPIWTIPHGVHQSIHHKNNCSPKDSTPYFVCLSTIEPRKNHMLLLHLWRRMVEERGKATVPRLILVGKRGWENENILDLLERAPALKDVVIEKNSLSDEDVASLLQNSNGLLFPSFTEGYGLPLTEAMSLNVPSICSDIPVLREVGEDIPLFIDPLDAPEWEKAIDDFCQHGPLWQAQKERLKTWTPVSWPQSVHNALEHCMSMKL